MSVNREEVVSSSSANFENPGIFDFTFCFIFNFNDILNLNVGKALSCEKGSIDMSPLVTIFLIDVTLEQNLLFFLIRATFGICINSIEVI